MNVLFETVIVGAGLAGASCAAVLSRRPGLLILDAGRVNRTPPVHQTVYPAASSIGGGICSPLMSRRARPVFRMKDAVAALRELRHETAADDLFSSSGVLKLAGSLEQAIEFRDAAEKWPGHGQWYTPEECLRNWPGLRAPSGLIHVLSGFSVSIPEWCERMIRYAVTNGAEYRSESRVLGWQESKTQTVVHYRDASGDVQSIKTGRLVLAPGADYLRFPELAALHLHPVKGQWVRITRPDSMAGAPPLPPLSGSGYVIDDGRSLILGSTFEHSYRHLGAIKSDVREMIQNASRMILTIEQSAVLGSGAAIRVTVPGIRLPMVGPLRTGSDVWIVSGLGAKGLLMAPLIASELQNYFESPGSIPKEFRVTYS